MLASNDPGSYEVRYGVRSALMTLWFLAVPTLCICVGIWKWPENRNLLFVGLGFFVIAVLALRTRLRGVLRRGTIVAIDSRGVFLGADLYGRSDELEPWSSIDAVVYFGGRRRNESGFRLTRFVGVVRQGFIVGYRDLAGSSLDAAKAAEAVARHGGGAPLLKAPDQYGLKSGPVVLPDEWLHWAVRPRPDDRVG